MGLNYNTMSISREIETLNTINKEKETQKELIARLERKLELYFTEQFKKNGTIYIYEFYNIDNRNDIIKKIGKNDYEYVRLNKLYDRVLKRIYKIFEQHEKYLDWMCNDLMGEKVEK